MANPYVTETVVKDPRMFMGRQVPLRRLLRHVQQMDCVCVVGPPGIGKSSLLHRLVQHEALLQTHLSVYLDMSDPMLRSSGALVTAVIQQLAERSGRQLVGSGMEGLEQGLGTLLEEDGLHMLLCLDNFDVFAAAHAGDHDFLADLRRLGFTRLLSLVVASVHSLDTLVRQRTIPRSLEQLFDACVDLGLLPAGEADRLIVEPVQQEGVELPSNALELARELGGRHPLYLQLVGYYLFEEISSADGAELQTVRERFSEASFAHQHRLWTHLKTEEKEAIRYYAGVLGVHPPSMDTRQSLILQGVIERRGGEYRLFTEQFGEVVRRRRQDLEQPLPVPDLGSAPPDEQTTSSQTFEDQVTLADQEVGRVPSDDNGEGSESEEGEAVATDEPVADASPAGAAEAPGTTTALASDAGVHSGLANQPSSSEVSSLSALGCYVSAITLDLAFIAAIVVARLVFQLPTREMYVLIGVSAILPALFLLLGRLGGGVWTRLFGWLIRRL